MDSRLVAFIAIAAILTVTPGADMALVTRHVLSGGRRAAFLATLGICSGCLVHASASAFGLSLILARSAAAFEGVKLVGSAYLVLLGVQALREAASPHSVPAGGDARALGAFVDRRCFVQGLLTNLLNPKVALFYLTFLPQFVPTARRCSSARCCSAAFTSAWGSSGSAPTRGSWSRFSAFLGAGRTRRGLQAATGTMLAGLGLRLAFERR